jgi:pimeloyl-ACP methyl ester carboxylesterase
MGLSDPSAFTRQRFRDFAVRFVGDVLDALELNDAVLVGASGGGIYAMWFALAHPQRVRGFVMLGSTPTLPGGRVPLPIRLMATPVLGAVMTRAVKTGPADAATHDGVHGRGRRHHAVPRHVRLPRGRRQ